jgi:hypothetical protein
MKVVVRAGVIAGIAVLSALTVVLAQGGGNLVKNAGAEQGSGPTPDGWDTGAEIDGVEYIWHATVGYKSKRSLCLKKTAQRYFPVAQWGQSVPVKAGARRVKVSAWVKARDARKAVLDVQFEGADGNSGHEWAAYVGAKEASDPPANHDWKLYTGTVDVPAGTTRMTVAPQIYGPGVVWFDDITASYAP